MIASAARTACRPPGRARARRPGGHGPANVRYLTGYVGTNAVALIGANGPLLLTDSRYVVSARAQTRGVEVVRPRDLLERVARLVGDVSPGGPSASRPTT